MGISNRPALKRMPDWLLASAIAAEAGLVLFSGLVRLSAVVAEATGSGVSWIPLG